VTVPVLAFFSHRIRGDDVEEHTQRRLQRRRGQQPRALRRRNCRDPPRYVKHQRVELAFGLGSGPFPCRTPALRDARSIRLHTLLHRGNIVSDDLTDFHGRDDETQRIPQASRQNRPRTVQAEQSRAAWLLSRTCRRRPIPSGTRPRPVQRSAPARAATVHP
jgi:hypothetical protein